MLGFKNFFGMGKVGGTILRTMEALSPISLHYGAGARALETTTTSGMGAAFHRATAVLGDTMEKMGASWKTIKGSENRPPFGELVGAYFKGFNVDDMARGIHKNSYESFSSAKKKVINRRQNIRIGVLGVGALSGGSALFMDQDNPMRSTLGFASRTGMHAGIGATLGALTGSRKAMYGYLGLAGANMLRSRDNLGPF